jgi:hypothetical protein
VVAAVVVAAEEEVAVALAATLEGPAAMAVE